MYQYSLPVPGDFGADHAPDLSQAVLDALPDAVIVCRPDGEVLACNHATERMLGWCAAELLGNDLRRAIPEFTARDASRARTIRLRRPDGRAVRFALVTTVATWKGGNVEVHTLRDAASELTALGERELFEHIGRDAPLHVVLTAIANWMNQALGDSVSSVNVFGESGDTITQCLGPEIPPPVRVALLDADLSSLCLDRALDPAAPWTIARAPAERAAFVTAWQLPIVGNGGRVVGLIVIFHRRGRAVGAKERELVLHAARLASFAIERAAAEQALRASEAKFRGLYESLMEGVFECGPDGRLQSLNPALVAMLGYDTAEELITHTDGSLSFADAREAAALLRRLLTAGEVRNAEHELRKKDGETVVVLINARAQVDYVGLPMGFEGTVSNITERKRAERLVFEEKERAQVTLQSIGEAVIRTDAEGRIDYMNPTAEALTGWTLFESRGRPIDTVLRVIDEATRKEATSPLLRCLREGAAPPPAEHTVLQSRTGLEVAIHSSVAPIRNRQGATLGAVTVFRDVTRERRLKRALSYQATHDALTGLINRREFDARLQAAVETARRGQDDLVLLYVDLDQFKIVNDTCGHPAGDRLLRDVTALLQARVRASDTIARLGGDEFGILLEACAGDQARKIAESIRAAVRDYRFVWNDNAMSIGASIGLVPIGRETESVASLMSAADIACYSAKGSGRNRVHVYDRTEQTGLHREMYWVARVTRAVEEGRLDLEAQPIRVVSDESPRRPTDFRELLVRLRDERGELVSPGDFIPAAERYNVMSAIDRWVVRAAVKLLRSQPGGGGAGGQLYALNLSGTSLNDPSFIEDTLTALEDRAVAAGICFEITETAAVSNLDQAAWFMNELRGRGCRFALDDFGSGLSSFRYLKTLPVDYLKIDGQFIRQIASDPVDRSMVEGICHVARALGIQTIAERVESAEVLESLERLGVNYVQGYFVGRPELLRLR